MLGISACKLQIECFFQPLMTHTRYVYRAATNLGIRGSDGLMIRTGCPDKKTALLVLLS